MREKLLFLIPTSKETVVIAILTILFTFLSFIAYVRTERLEPPLGVVVLYGFPLEFLKITIHGRIGLLQESEIIWAGLVVDLILYFLLSFLIVRVATELIESTS